jgi:hypothetical protein
MLFVQELCRAEAARLPAVKLHMLRRIAKVKYD